MKLDLSTNNKHRQPYCSIHVTSENGALCIINPLFLHEHGDKWLTPFSGSHLKMKRRSVPWCFGPVPEIKQDTEGLEKYYFNNTEEQHDCSEKVNKDEDQNMPEPDEETTKVYCDIKDPETKVDTYSSNIPKMRKQRISKRQVNLGTRVSQSHTQLQIDIRDSNKISQNKQHEKRHSLVSWIEVDQPAECTLQKSSSETSLNSSDRFLLPPLPELDSVSISSIEEDGDCHTSHSRIKHSHGLGDIVRHSLLAVSTALTGLVSPEKHLINRIQQLAEDPETYFGGTVQTFVCNMHKGSGHNQSSIDMLQSIRQLLTSLKAYLLESNEIWEILEHQEIDESKIGSIIEASLYKCMLKPVRNAIYSHLLAFHTKDESLARLLDNQKKIKTGDLTEQKPRAGLPGPVTMERIQQKLTLMHMAYSPEKMTTHLLKVCKIIYESMEASSGKKDVYGADDFLPVLIHVLTGCDLTPVQLDVEYMMELADPSQLQGEGGYYLTTMFGALYHISTFNTVSRQLSVEAQNSIRQWQRRRTIHHKQSTQTYVQRINKGTPDTKYKTIFQIDNREDA
ncbi:ras and Rab interactor 3-like [Pelodytes ibericus]